MEKTLKRINIGSIGHIGSKTSLSNGLLRLGFSLAIARTFSEIPIIDNGVLATYVPILDKVNYSAPHRHKGKHKGAFRLAMKNRKRK